MSRKDFDTNKYLELAKSLKLDSMDDINDLFKNLSKAIIENSLNAEMDEHLGYDKWDQSSRNKSNNYRKGYSNKKVKSSFGEFDIKIPRDKDAMFEPTLVKKYQTDISHFDEKVIALYSKGLSTREIQNYIKDLYDVELNKDTISRITDKILPEINEWLERPIQPVYPVIYIDGIRFKVKEDNKFIEKSVYILFGINTDGFKEVLHFSIAESESAKHWLTIFNQLKEKGLKDVLIFCCDNLSGISEAIKSAFPESMIQKCIIHQIRNSTKFVKYTDLKEFTSDMKKIYQASSIELALDALEEFNKKWANKYNYAIKSWNQNIDELTTFFNFPKELRKLIYTTNSIENLNRNIRKLTKSKNGFCTINSLKKMLYFSIINQSKHWETRIQNWGIIYNQLKILFDDRL